MWWWRRDHTRPPYIDKAQQPLTSWIFYRTFHGIRSAGGFTPFSLELGPNKSIWFSAPSIGSITSNGAVTQYLATNIYQGFSEIASVDGSIYQFAVGPQEHEFLIRFIPPATIASIDFGPQLPFQFNGLTVGPDGNLWYGICLESCPGFGGSVDSVGPTLTGGTHVPLPSNYFGIDVASGPDHNVYVTGSFTGNGTPTMSDSVVFKISTMGSLLATFNLPIGSSPGGIVTGPDRNLWITETGTNKIGRLSTSGVLTEFALPTTNAGPTNITAGDDGALWFTENAANAIGRITTAGVITEYPVPPPRAGLFDLISCPSVCDPGSHGCIWFTESNAGKIGKFQF